MSMDYATSSDVRRHDDGDCDGPGLFGCEVCNAEVVPAVCFDCGDTVDPWGDCEACAADVERAKAAHPSAWRGRVGTPVPDPEDFVSPSDFEPFAWPDDLCRTCGGPRPCVYHDARCAS